MRCQEHSAVADIRAGALQLLIGQCHIKANHDHIRHLPCQKNAIFTEILLQIRRSHQIDFLFRIILFQILNHHIPGCNDLIPFNITPHFCQFVNICFRRFRRIIRKKYISLPCFLHFLQEIQRPVEHIRIQIKRPVHIEDKQFCLL